MPASEGINKIMNLVVIVVAGVSVAGFTFGELITLLGNTTMVNDPTIGAFVKIFAILLALAFAFGVALIGLKQVSHGKE